ncbi:MAG: DUF4126 domain-containing protein [Phycisphaeraceae bacterium]|nr:DUF4126 domain-containing protein [Phycisphaeraceae bacterium]
MDLIYASLMAVGLSAACGFRVFVPMFVISIAANGGHMQLGESFDWMGSDFAMIVFGLATAMEIGAYYVPWIDNMLDTIASPAAVAAGAIAATSCISGQSELTGWIATAITGGGIAGGVQALTVATRMTSLATTGGVGNPVVSTVEAVTSTVMSVIAVVLPLIVILFVLGFGYMIHRIVRRRRRKRQQAPMQDALPVDSPPAQSPPA